MDLVATCPRVSLSFHPVRYSRGAKFSPFFFSPLSRRSLTSLSTRPEVSFCKRLRLSIFLDYSLTVV